MLVSISLPAELGPWGFTTSTSTSGAKVWNVIRELRRYIQERKGQGWARSEADIWHSADDDDIEVVSIFSA